MFDFLALARSFVRSLSLSLYPLSLSLRIKKDKCSVLHMKKARWFTSSRVQQHAVYSVNWKIAGCLSLPVSAYQITKTLEVKQDYHNRAMDLDFHNVQNSEESQSWIRFYRWLIIKSSPYCCILMITNLLD